MAPGLLRKAFVAVGLIVVVFLVARGFYGIIAGSEEPVPLTREQAIGACIQLCEESSFPLGRDSQCLGPLDGDWVCDLAHDPREQQDNNVENQCQSYLTGSHLQFVEVTPDCEFIRTS